MLHCSSTCVIMVMCDLGTIKYFSLIEMMSQTHFLMNSCFVVAPRHLCFSFIMKLSTEPKDISNF